MFAHQPRPRSPLLSLLRRHSAPFLALLLPAAALAGWYAEPPPAGPAPAAVEGAPPLGLPELLGIALERHPRLEAQRASLAAAEDGSRALEALRVAAVVDRELPIRRRQAAIGVTAAAAAVDQTEHEVRYAVTRAYFSLIYAREQQRVARGVVDRLSATYDTAKKQLDAGARDVTADDVQRVRVYQRLAEARVPQAVTGEKRALAALKEALGRGCEFEVAVAAGRLFEPAAQPVQADVVALALARRGDLVQASVFAEAACLEVEAQGTSHHLKMETFAAGSDIHSRQVPQEVRNTEYRPGAIPPEMPTLLAGSKADRVQRAADYSSKAQAVVEETRHLICLEVEDAFLRWEQAAEEAARNKAAAENAEQLADNLDQALTTGQRVRVDDVVSARVLAAQARAAYNEALYREILALADLERATAGGFCARLAEGLAKPAQPAKTEGGEKK